MHFLVALNPQIILKLFQNNKRFSPLYATACELEARCLQNSVSYRIHSYFQEDKAAISLCILFASKGI